MKYAIEQVPAGTDNEVIIRCHSIDDAVQNLIDFLESPSEKMLGFADEKIHLIDPAGIVSIETMDGRVFIHGDDQVYETRKRLYELEQELGDFNFLRASKWMILNISKIESVRPLFDGRLEAQLKNKKKANISRKYVPVLRKKLGI